jgi:hypothetical protein
VGVEEMKRYAEVDSLKLCYFPQIGYQVAIVRRADRDINEQIDHPGTDLRFQVWFCWLGIL